MVPWLKFESMPYTVQKALKVSISKIIGLMSSGLLLWLGLCHMAEAVNAAHGPFTPKDLKGWLPAKISSLKQDS